MQVQIAPPIESDEELQDLYNWVDEVPLSRPKKNICRDFADGVLFAEMVNHYFPKLVDMHSYSSANSLSQKQGNWKLLNQKVLKKLGYQVHDHDIDEVCRAVPGAIERVLRQLQDKVLAAQNGELRVAQGRAPSVPGDRGKAPAAVAAAAAVPGAGPSVAPSGAAAARAGSAGVGGAGGKPEVDAQLLLEKDQTIAELKEMVGIMSEKIKKLEQLVQVKDQKIEAMSQKLQRYGLA